MPVRMMTSADRAHLPNVETVTDYHGHATTEWRHGFKCPHYRQRPEVQHDDCLPERDADGHRTGCHFMDPLYMETTHVGLVLATGERNGYDDSDFTVTVWNPETGAPETFTYATTRGWTYPNSAVEDATPEARAAYKAWDDARRAAARQAREEYLAKRVAVGKLVRVVKGRKLPAGTIAEVFWVGPDQFTKNYYSPIARSFGFDEDLKFARCGVRLDDGTRVFLASANVEVIQPEEQS